MTSMKATRTPRALIAGLEQRLREPLRLAIAGMVKAGKSTLLNAMLGEQIAPTDTAECTRVVTWYRYSATPTITMHPREGEPRADAGATRSRTPDDRSRRNGGGGCRVDRRRLAARQPSSR